VAAAAAGVDYYYYYYAAFNAPCVGHKADESQDILVMTKLTTEIQQEYDMELIC